MCEQISSKNVVTRKKHQCFACLQMFQQGTVMNRSVNVFDGRIYSIYMCKTCEQIIQCFDTNDYDNGFDEGCVLEAIWNDNGFKPSIDGLCTQELTKEYLRYIES